MIPKFNMGNLALHKGEVVTVMAINEFHQYCIEDSGGMREKWVNDLEPIPLTAEWLGKFEGFYFLESLNRWNGQWGENGSALIKWDDGYDLWAIELGQGMSKAFRYVHQFQNFWQALTENELKIKQ